MYAESDEKEECSLYDKLELSLPEDKHCEQPNVHFVYLYHLCYVAFAFAVELLRLGEYSITVKSIHRLVTFQDVDLQVITTKWA